MRKNKLLAFALALLMALLPLGAAFGETQPEIVESEWIAGEDAVILPEDGELGLTGELIAGESDTLEESPDEIVDDLTSLLENPPTQEEIDAVTGAAEESPAQEPAAEEDSVAPSAADPSAMEEDAAQEEAVVEEEAAQNETVLPQVEPVPEEAPIDGQKDAQSAAEEPADETELPVLVEMPVAEDEEQTVEEQTAEEQTAVAEDEEQPGEEQTAVAEDEEQPGEEQTAVEEQSEEQPGEEQPAVEEQSEEQSEEQPAEEQPAEEEEHFIEEVTEEESLPVLAQYSAEEVAELSTIRVFAVDDEYAIVSDATSLPSGETLQLYASADPADATPQAFVWESSDERVATVSGTGLVTARVVKAQQTVTITATAVNESGEDVRGTMEITVKPVEIKRLDGEGGLLSVKLNDQEIEGCVNLTLSSPVTLTWGILPAEADRGAVLDALPAGDPSIATLEATGAHEIRITPAAVGTFEIDLSASQPSGIPGTEDDHASRHLTITVDEPIAAAAPDGTPVLTSIEVGLKKSVNILDAANLRSYASGKITYKSSNKRVVSVSGKGVIKGVKKGSATITVTQAKPKKTVKIKVTVKPKAVTSVSRSGSTPASAVIYLDEPATIPLSVSVNPSTASQQVKWTSSNPKVAVVNASGNGFTGKSATVHGLSSGTAVITAMARDGSGKKASVTVTVGYKPAQLYIEDAQAIVTGGSVALKARALRANGQPAVLPALEWESSNENVATVDSSGKVTGVGTGTAQITVTAKDFPGVTGSADIDVAQGVEAITLDPASGIIDWQAGERELQLTAAVEPANAENKALTWTTSNAGVATVDQTGKVTAKQPGKVTITAAATDGTGVKGTATIAVQNNPTGMTVRYGANTNATTVYVAKSKKITLAPILTGGATETGTFKWTTANKKIATVTAGGVVKGVKAGKSTKITVRSNKYPSLSRTITVKVMKKATKSITLKAKATTLGNGGSTTITATIKPSGASTALQWFSSNPAIATVEGNGKTCTVRAVPGMTGSVSIYAMALDGTGKKSKAGTIRVGAPVTGVAIEGAKSLHVGEELTLTANVTGGTGSRNVAWSSSDESVAAIDADGKVTGVRCGPTTITATAQDGSGKKASVVIHVVESATDVTILGLHTVSVGSTTPLSANILPIEAANSTVAWASLNPDIASVDPSGKVTGVSCGKTTITATVDGITAEFSMAVTAPATGLTLWQNGKRVGESLTLTTLLDPPAVQLTARMEPDIANASVTWNSSNTAVASVNANGIVTPLKPGSATITATARDGSGKAASVIINVNADAVKVSEIPVPSGYVTDENGAIIVAANPSGPSITLSASTNAVSGGVLWSSDSDQVTVDAQGNVTIAAGFTGIVHITAAPVDNPDGDGASQTITLNVVLPATGVHITADADSLYVGQALTLTATVEPAGTLQQVAWSLEGDGADLAANDDGTATLTGTAGGSVTVTATVKDGSGVSGSFPVEVWVPAQSIAINGAQDGDWVYAGQTLELTAQVDPDDVHDETVQWSVSEGDASIDANGELTVTGSTGTTITVTAASTDGFATASITLLISEFTWTVNADNVTITGYNGDSAVVQVPTAINHVAVTKIGDGAFEGNETITTVTLPNAITCIGARAFNGCTSLASMSGY